MDRLSGALHSTSFVVERRLSLARVCGALLQRLFARCGQLCEVAQRQPTVVPVVHVRSARERHALEGRARGVPRCRERARARRGVQSVGFILGKERERFQACESGQDGRQARKDVLSASSQSASIELQNKMVEGTHVVDRAAHGVQCKI